MDEKDWTQQIEEMKRKRLEIFAIHAMGILSCEGTFINMTPEQVFDYIYAIGERKDNGVDGNG